MLKCICTFCVKFIVFLIVCITAAICDASYYMKKDHSLIKPYAARLASTTWLASHVLATTTLLQTYSNLLPISPLGEQLQWPPDDHWEFVGHTIVTNNYVRLTADVRSSQGAIWNTAPCKLRDWELHVHFKIHGSGQDLYGDGFAIWYSKHRMELGSVFGARDYFSGLGVFLDTYANQNGQHNHGHPYISAMVSNGSQHYDHDMDGTHTSLSGCQANIRGQMHETFIAIRYEHNTLMVSTDLEGTNSWKLCFKVEGVHLPTAYYFGVSAATGDLSDNHDIISLKLYDIGVIRKDEDNASVDYSHIEPSADSASPPRDRVEDVKGSVKSGWKIAGLIVFGIIAVCLCAVIGYIFYTWKSQQTSRKRFY